jgi:hypothetical protein
MCEFVGAYGILLSFSDFLILWEDMVSSCFTMCEFVGGYGILLCLLFIVCGRIRYSLVLLFVNLWEDTVSSRFTSYV